MTEKQVYEWITRETINASYNARKLRKHPYSGSMPHPACPRDTDYDYDIEDCQDR